MNGEIRPSLLLDSDMAIIIYQVMFVGWWDLGCDWGPDGNWREAG